MSRLTRRKKTNIMEIDNCNIFIIFNSTYFNWCLRIWNACALLCVLLFSVIHLRWRCFEARGLLFFLMAHTRKKELSYTKTRYSTDVRDGNIADPRGVATREMSMMIPTGAARRPKVENCFVPPDPRAGKLKSPSGRRGVVRDRRRT